MTYHQSPFLPTLTAMRSILFRRLVWRFFSPSIASAEPPLQSLGYVPQVDGLAKCPADAAQRLAWFRCAALLAAFREK